MKTHYRNGDWELATRVARSLLRQPDLEIAIKGSCFMMLATGTENAQGYLQAGLEEYQRLADENPPSKSLHDRAFEQHLGLLLVEGKEVLDQMQSLKTAAAARSHQHGDQEGGSASSGSTSPSAVASQQGGQKDGLTSSDSAAPAMESDRQSDLTSSGSDGSV